MKIAICILREKRKFYKGEISYHKNTIKRWEGNCDLSYAKKMIPKYRKFIEEIDKAINILNECSDAI